MSPWYPAGGAMGLPLLRPARCGRSGAGQAPTFEKKKNSLSGDGERPVGLSRRGRCPALAKRGSDGPITGFLVLPGGEALLEDAAPHPQ